MLSKFIYKALMVFALAVVAQVGYSQNYVSSDEAIILLEEAIVDLEAGLNVPFVYTGNVQVKDNQTENKLMISLMTAVKGDIEALKNVKSTMDTWYEKANAEIPARKTKMTLALDSVKDLLS
ncbi:MAG: hypothetical protein ACJATI_000371 [Halioglobus sp.]|jgi:hypothetical protein